LIRAKIFRVFQNFQSVLPTTDPRGAALMRQSKADFSYHAALRGKPYIILLLL